MQCKRCNEMIKIDAQCLLAGHKPKFCPDCYAIVYTTCPTCHMDGGREFIEANGECLTCRHVAWAERMVKNYSKIYGMEV